MSDEIDRLYSGITRAGVGSWTGHLSSSPLTPEALDFAHARFMEQANDPTQPHWYEWACSSCPKRGTAISMLLDCPYCGSPSWAAEVLRKATDARNQPGAPAADEPETPASAAPAPGLGHEPILP